MFQFPAFPPIYLCVQYMVSTHYCRCVPTFGYLWVVGCLHLTIAFRSLPRPSSAPIAKAFTLCSSLLNLWVSIRFSFVEIVYPFFLSDLSLNLFGCYTFLDIFRFSLHYSVFKVLMLVNSPYFWKISFAFSFYPLGLVENKRIELLTPCVQGRCSPSWANSPCLVGLGGLEPPTSRLSGARSNHLSYKPTFFFF